MSVGFNKLMGINGPVPGRRCMLYSLCAHKVSLAKHCDPQNAAATVKDTICLDMSRNARI